MDQVRARFYVASSQEFGTPDANGNCTGQITLNAVSRGDQNKQWAAATPSGTLTLYINNGEAFEAMRAMQRQGLDVDVLLTPVTVKRPDDGHEFRPSDMDDTSCYGGPNTCGDCGFRRVDTYTRRGESIVTHTSDVDAGWTPDV